MDNSYWWEAMRRYKAAVQSGAHPLILRRLKELIEIEERKLKTLISQHTDNK